MFRSSTLNILIVTLLVTTSTILAHFPVHQINRSVHPRDTNTTDPCNTPLTCGPILIAYHSCTNSTDLFCGCDAWINFAGDCAACGVLYSGQTDFTVPTQVAMIRGLCECQECSGVMNTVVTAGFGMETAGEVCAVEYVGCTDCIRRTDVYLAQVVTGYFAQLCDGA